MHVVIYSFSTTLSNMLNENRENSSGENEIITGCLIPYQPGSTALAKTNGLLIKICGILFSGKDSPFYCRVRTDLCCKPPARNSETVVELFWSVTYFNNVSISSIRNKE